MLLHWRGMAGGKGWKDGLSPGGEGAGEVDPVL